MGKSTWFDDPFVGIGYVTVVEHADWDKFEAAKQKMEEYASNEFVAFYLNPDVPCEIFIGYDWSKNCAYDLYVDDGCAITKFPTQFEIDHIQHMVELITETTFNAAPRLMVLKRIW